MSYAVSKHHKTEPVYVIKVTQLTNYNQTEDFIFLLLCCTFASRSNFPFVSESKPCLYTWKNEHAFDSPWLKRYILMIAISSLVLSTSSPWSLLLWTETYLTHSWLQTNCWTECWHVVLTLYHDVWLLYNMLYVFVNGPKKAKITSVLFGDCQCGHSTSPLQAREGLHFLCFVPSHIVPSSRMYNSISEELLELS